MMTEILQLPLVSAAPPCIVEYLLLFNWHPELMTVDQHLIFYDNFVLDDVSMPQIKLLFAAHMIVHHQVNKLSLHFPVAWT